MRTLKQSLPYSEFTHKATSLVLLLLAGCFLANAQTFTVLHSFSGGRDGGNPLAGLTRDSAGNLYGTTASGGNSGGGCTSNGFVGCGTVFKLTPKQGGWVLTPLYTFKGNTENDGAAPVARVIFGPSGNLYGTTEFGGGTGCENGLPGCGTIFKLSPPFSVCKSATCPWTETILYRFSGGTDGKLPQAEVLFDSANNMYGTAAHGGLTDNGVVFELSPSGAGWTQSVIYNFTAGTSTPLAGLIFDDLGNLYGTTLATVFELSRSGSNWTEETLYTVTPDGLQAGVILDQSGNLYGAWGESVDQGGFVFELTPSGVGWVEQTLYTFPGCCRGPAESLVFDSAGSLYGTTAEDGDYICVSANCGTVFKLTPDLDGTWTNTYLHQFSGGSDGAFPFSNVIFDTDGNLYGTASSGGLSSSGCLFGYGCGVIWEITP